MSLYLGDKLISGIGQDRIADTLPIGAIIEWDSDLIPENWLLLNGQAVSRTVYSELFAIYGTTYGAGDGSTTFNLPDRRTRVAVGRDANDEDFNILGNIGGEKTHKLVQAELPNVRLTIHRTESDETPLTYWNTNATTSNAYAGLGYNEGANILHTSPLGNGESHNNLQPYIVTNFIVKAKLYTTEFIGDNVVIDNWDSDSSTNVLSAKVGKALHEEIRPIITGGTGANNAEEALANLGAISKKLLWQNASPESAFIAQTIELDLSKYAEIEIEFRYHKTLDMINSQKGLVNKQLLMGLNSADSIFRRNVTINSDGIKFSETSGTQTGAGAGASNIRLTDNDYLVPTTIYGIKGGK